MSEERKYSAQEMREMSGHLIADICDTENECNEYRNTIGSFDLSDCELALLQAADAEEELANLKTTSGGLEKRALEYADQVVSSPLLTNTIKRLIAERNSLKARLKAIQKSLDDHQDCHKCSSYPICNGVGCISAVVEITKILRAAHGDVLND